MLRARLVAGTLTRAVSDAAKTADVRGFRINEGLAQPVGLGWVPAEADQWLYATRNYRLGMMVNRMRWQLYKEHIAAKRTNADRQTTGGESFR